MNEDEKRQSKRKFRKLFRKACRKFGYDHRKFQSPGQKAWIVKKYIREFCEEEQS